MKKLFLELSFATLCAALLAACGGDSGSSADSLDESSSSSEMDGAESSDSEDLNSNGSEGGESSGSSEGNSSGRSEEPESSSEGASSASEEPESSGSEDVESSGSGEGSSASVPGGSSDASVYDADKNTLTDLRDGQTYRTVKIGTQTWMAENLNYETSNSYCYRDSVSYCAKYGRLYTWAAAVGRSEDECGYGYECGLPSGDVRGVCPKGWHLPSRTEWEALFTAVGGSSTAGSKLKSQTGWTAYSGITNEDAFGFSALPAGYRGSRGSFYDGGDRAYFWSSTEYYSTSAYNMYLYYNYGSGFLDNNYKYIGFSVRCLMD